MLKLKRSAKNNHSQDDANSFVDARKTINHRNCSKTNKDIDPSHPSKTKKYAVRLSKFANKFGETLIWINSKSAYKVLSRLSEDFDIKVVKHNDDGLLILTKSKHLSQVIAILKNLCYDYKIIKIIGVVPTFFNLFARFGVVIGIVAIVVTAVVCSSFVTRVSVAGVDNAALMLQINSLLDENDVRRGQKLANIDANELAKRVLSLNGVAFASVTKSGGHISVYVKEELNPAEFEEIEGATVIAKKRAVVTRVIVDGGTAVVKFGDVVNAGDLLIDGYTEYGDDKISVRASGEVFGKVYYQKKLYFADTTLKKVYGNAKKVTKLSFFGIVPKTPKSKYQDYELKTRVQQNGFLIPYTTYTFEFREIKTIQETLSLQDDDLKRRAYSALLGEINSAAKVLATYYEIEDSADGKYVTVTIEAEEKIS